MNVLVTGGLGFLGSHICELGIKSGDKVVCVDNFTDYELKESGYKTNASKIYNKKFLKKLGVEIQQLDLTKDFDIGVILSEIKDIDYIIHTAAQPTVTLAVKNPRYDFDNNVLATFNILEIARKLDIPVSICSSIHVFGNDINENLEELPDRFTHYPEAFNEDYSFLKGKVTPLHASKAINEIHARAFIDTYGMEVGIMRLTGMYGPRQFAGVNHGWVSNFIFRMLKGLPLTIFGTDKQVRDILYASDAAKVFYDFYDNPNAGTYVIGGGVNNIISIKQMIEKTSEYLGVKPVLDMKEARDFDLNYFVGDTTKAWQNLNWEPTVKPDEGLKLTADWIKENLTLFEVSE